MNSQKLKHLDVKSFKLMNYKTCELFAFNLELSTTFDLSMSLLHVFIGSITYELYATYESYDLFEFCELK